MGGGWSGWSPVPVYDRPVSTAADYDYWGFVPPGLKPSQHVWHTFYSDPRGREALNFPVKNDPRPWNQQYGIADSVPSMILRSYFVDANDVDWSTFTHPVQGDVYPGLPSPGVVQEMGSPLWDPQWYAKWNEQQANNKMGEPGGMCNPLNFPNCTMADFKIQENQLYDFAGQFHEGTALWEETIDKLYTDFYVNGNADLLDQVNTEDTSGYDPCAEPGFFVQVIPIIMGALTGTGFQKTLATDFRATLSNLTMNAWSAGTITFGFFWTRAVLDVYGSESENLGRAAFSLTVPMSLSLGDYLINKGYNAQPNTLYAVAGVVGWFLIQPLLKSILGAPRLVFFVLRVIKVIIGTISTFLCRLVSEKPDACAATTTTVDGEKVFQDARRWDAASIAAKLTDEIRAEEGWLRDDPRAEFAFKAFLTGPGMLDVARGPGDGNPQWKSGVSNPFGSIYAPLPSQFYELGGGTHGDAGMQYGPGTIYGWDGKEAGYLDVANHNFFSCQNWEIMRNDTGPTPTPETGQVARTFTKWVKAVKDAANIPANLRHAGIGSETSGIPGWKGGTDTFAPLRPVLTPQQWLDFVDRVYAAPTLEQRYTFVHDWQNRNFDPTDPAVLLWLEANEIVYTYLGLKVDKTAEDVYKYIIGNPQFNATPEGFSAFLYAAAATTGSDELKQFWDAAPVAMIGSAVKFAPPKTASGVVLPYGWPNALNDPIYHQHPSTPLKPVPGDDNLCGLNLSIIRNPPPNKYNLPLTSLLSIVTNLLKSEQVCQTCSIAQVATLFCYKLLLEASQIPDAGIGYAVQELLSLNWSDRNMAAAIWELAVRVENQKDLQDYWFVFMGAKTWKGVDYTQRIEDWKNMGVLDFDDSVNLCTNNALGSLTTLHFPKKPPGILKILPPPPQGPRGPVRLGPTPDQGSVCNVTLQMIQFPGDSADFNMPLDQMLQRVKQTLENKSICVTTTGCPMEQIATLFAYQLLLEAHETTLPEGVGRVCHQLNVLFKWSDLSMSAALLDLQTPVKNQSYLKEYLETFWTLTYYDFYNWTADIEDWLSMNGYYDHTAVLCGSGMGSDPLGPGIVSRPIGLNPGGPVGLNPSNPVGFDPHKPIKLNPIMKADPNFPAQCEFLYRYLIMDGYYGSPDFPINASLTDIETLLNNLWLTPNRPYCNACDLQQLGALSTLSIALSFNPPSIGEFIVTAQQAMHWSNNDLIAGIQVLLGGFAHQNALAYFCSSTMGNAVDSSGKNWAAQVAAWSQQKSPFSSTVIQYYPAQCAINNE